LFLVALGSLFVFAGVRAWPRRPPAPTGEHATERQIGRAERLGIVVPAGVTRDELLNLVCERVERT
jgi:hypothetical protein